MKIYLKVYLVLLSLLFTIVIKGQATCGGTANIPPSGTTAINGVVITTVSTGAVVQYTPAFSGCASLSANSLLVGRHATAHDATPAPWTVTLTFDKPVNDLVILLAGGGNLAGTSYNEDFNFNGNNGSISTSTTQSCHASTSGNRIGIWSDKRNDGGGRFKIHSARPFTQLVINGAGGADGAFLGICSSSIVAVPPKCYISNATSATGWQAEVYDAPDDIIGWTEISASASFPTVSYSQIATFDYNENAGTNTAFDVIFSTNTYGLTPANPKIQNYVGTQIYNNPTEDDPDKINEDYAVLFSKTIASGEEGSYQFDLGYGDDHIFIYKNGVKLNQQENAYAVTPLDNFATINVVVGDVISILVVEEYEFNTEVQMIATKIVMPPVINLTINCPATSVDLGAAHTGTAPGSSSLVWFTNSTHTGAALSGTQITQAGNGTYYAFYYNTTGSCYSAASNPVTVTTSICQVPFTCGTGYYLTQHPSTGNVTTLYSLDNTTNPFTITQIGTPTPYDVNAIGYNTVDNFIYGMRTDTGFLNHIVKIDANGVMASSLVPGLPTGGYNSGAFDNAGNYYILSFGSNRMYKIDVTNSTFVSVPLSRALSVNDVTYDLTSNLFYGYDSANRVLVSINPTSGAVTDIGVANTIFGASEMIGAMYSDLNGNIYGNSDDGTGFYQFNKVTGIATKISSSIAASGNDGANCPSAIIYPSDLSVTKTDGKTTYTPGTINTYTIVVKNNSPFGVVNANVLDNVPAGIPAVSVTYTAVASTGSTTNVVGIRTGAIDDLVSLAVDGTVTYTVKIFIPIIFAGNLVNTVTVTPPANSSDSDMSNNTATDTDLGAPCYKPAATGTTVQSQHGITSLGRAGANNGNWPMVRNNAWTVLESKSKGFVVNRIATTVLVEALANPVEGMIVYDEEADCLKINTDGTSGGWKCFNIQACPVWTLPPTDTRF